ncbi:MAG TPA: aminotransferase class I/II-fold pyridoxal phosphate-dependent enzyme [Gemmatimonadaceae bacterium]|jgi:aspartate aminotransferase|nr:aminotransferase class I/II-fold pyridoxal phosphate-dependent enzyme [Gemmatimonadaceae bacterium]
MPPSAAVQHPLDEISLGLIVQIRERLLKAQAAGKKVYRLESGDPNFSVPPHVLEAVGKAGAEGKTHYIPNSGIPELRKALAEKAVRKNGLVGTTDEDIFLTNGAMHALYVAFGALLSPGDEVILPDPMWTEVAENIRLAGGVTVGVPLRADHDFEYDTAEIEAAITPRTTAIFLNTPQNPTGAVLSEQTLREIADIAKRHDLWLISDEAYEDVIYEPHKHFSIGSFVPEYAEKVISIYSFSKSYAMSGLRTGYIVTKSPLLHDRIPKLLRCTINGVNSLAQWAALAAVTGDQSQLATMRAEYLVRRDALISALSTIEGVRPFIPRGAFYVWAELDPAIYKRLGVADAHELSDKLAAIGIGSAPGVAFGQTCDDAIRFAYSCATKMVTEGAEALRRALTDPDVLHGRASA